ncbi:MAG: diphthine--ammonia ligase [Planctomycetota bacterium]
MDSKQRVLFCWSGGKDSALCLHRVLASGRFEVVALLTTLNAHYRRVSMHGIREEVLEIQAQRIGLPLEKMFVSQSSTNEEYADNMRAILLRYKALGVEHVIYGDIFLEDLRRWREDNLAQVGMKGVFPLWQNDTKQLVSEFVELGFRAVLCCVNDAYLGQDHVGRELNSEFIASLPLDVDACGENGEYHSFVYAGPIFREPLAIQVGEIVYRPLELPHSGASSSVCPPPSATLQQRPQTKGFWFCDVTLATLGEVAP